MLARSITDTDVDNATNTLLVSGAVAGVGAVTQNAGVAPALAGTYGHLTLNADGSYPYIADQNAADALATGVTATDVFSYTVKDADGLVSNSTTLTITVTGTNDAPVAVADVGAVDHRHRCRQRHQHAAGVGGGGGRWRCDAERRGRARARRHLWSPDAQRRWQLPLHCRSERGRRAGHRGHRHRRV